MPPFLLEDLPRDPILWLLFVFVLGDNVIKSLTLSLEKKHKRSVLQMILKSFMAISQGGIFLLNDPISLGDFVYGFLGFCGLFIGIIMNL